MGNKTQFQSYQWTGWPEYESHRGTLTQANTVVEVVFDEPCSSVEIDNMASAVTADSPAIYFTLTGVDPSVAEDGVTIWVPLNESRSLDRQTKRVRLMTDIAGCRYQVIGLR